MKRGIIFFILLILLVGGGAYYYGVSQRPGTINLTGIVTTDEVIVSSEIQGRLQQLLVKQGDTVTNGQLLGTIQPKSQLADVAFFASNEQQAAAQVAPAKADLENARLLFEREETLHKQGAESQQAFDQARLNYESAKARVEALDKQTLAAAAQKKKADVTLGYTKIYAPHAGVVDTRAALQGEVVNPGQAIVTLIDQDDLWVRVDVEETYIDRIHIGDKMTVRLPSGAERVGDVFYRSVDADFATQRDVSRTKRDIRTFEIRLRCDNKDRSLAVGMTAYVALSPDKH